jgi:hypothetical protein
MRLQARSAAADTTLTRDWIEQRVTHRWPDKVGGRIEPGAAGLMAQSVIEGTP